MGKKKAHSRRMTAFEQDLAKWMKDPAFKEKYDLAMARIVLSRIKSGTIPGLVNGREADADLTT